MYYAIILFSLTKIEIFHYKNSFLKYNLEIV